jgi:hypothetical protein
MIALIQKFVSLQPLFSREIKQLTIRKTNFQPANTSTYTAARCSVIIYAYFFWSICIQRLSIKLLDFQYTLIMAVDHASGTLVLDPVRCGWWPVVITVILFCGSTNSYIGLQTGNTKYKIPYAHWWQSSLRSHQNQVNNRQLSIRWKLRQPSVALLMGTEHVLWIFTVVMPNRTTCFALISN